MQGFNLRSSRFAAVPEPGRLKKRRLPDDGGRFAAGFNASWIHPARSNSDEIQQFAAR